MEVPQKGTIDTKKTSKKGAPPLAHMALFLSDSL